MFDSTILYYLISPTGRQHRVERWGSYGIVVPSLFTTNGSARFVAKRVRELRSVGWKVERV